MNLLFKNIVAGWVKQVCNDTNKVWYISKQAYINRLLRFGFDANTFVSNMQYSNLEYGQTYNFSFFES